MTGGVLGGLAGLLVGIGALAIPGIGPVLAAGPLAAALGPALGALLTGAAIGAGAGAIAGALVGMGMPEDEAQVYEQRFRQGRILVTVRGGANRYNEAERSCAMPAPKQIRLRQRRWRVPIRASTALSRARAYAQRRPPRRARPITPEPGQTDRREPCACRWSRRR